MSGLLISLSFCAVVNRFSTFSIVLLVISSRSGRRKEIRFPGRNFSFLEHLILPA